MAKQNQSTTSIYYFINTLIALVLIACQSEEPNYYADSNWKYYQGGPNRNQYKAFNQINTSNAHQLKLLWTYDSEEADPDNRSQIQCNPLVIDGVVYGTSPVLKLFAIDAATGEEYWKFDPSQLNEQAGGLGANRGLAYWEKDNDKRLFYTVGASLFAIDAHTGKPIQSFGQSGKINLKENLDRAIDQAYYGNNSPGAIYKNLIIVGGRVSEGADHAPGHIRAFDVLTGARKWIFHTIPFPEEFGHETWPDSAYLKSGGANSWAGFSIDQANGIVYAPTGSASFDFYGGDRHGQNLFANSIIALDASTGKRLWHFQTRHHDLWDRDLPAPPNLIQIQKDGKEVPGLVQISKSGHLFVFNRITGAPIHPIEEVPAPASELEGEKAWPTQPVPTGYPQFSRGTIQESDLAQRSTEANNFAREAFLGTNYGEFRPFSTKSQVLFPGMDGGGEWGGAAYDPESSILFVNSNEMTWDVKMNPYAPLSLGQSVYQTNCQNCHGEHFEGSQLYGNVPTLKDIQKRKPGHELVTLIKNGRGVMPAFASLSEAELNAVVKYISNEPEANQEAIKKEKQWPYPYVFNGYKKLNAPDGLPIITPPWGQLTAINMNTAEIVWQVPLGNIDSLDIEGHPVTGTENYGGPVVTSGGVLFIAATSDEKFRVFDKQTGNVLFETQLPAAGYATPATYMVDGKQYVIIACGGGKLGTKSGSKYLAFGLPD